MKENIMGRILSKDSLALYHRFNFDYTKYKGQKRLLMLQKYIKKELLESFGYRVVRHKDEFYVQHIDDSFTPLKKVWFTENENSTKLESNNIKNRRVISKSKNSRKKIQNYPRNEIADIIISVSNSDVTYKVLHNIAKTYSIEFKDYVYSIGTDK